MSFVHSSDQFTKHSLRAKSLRSALFQQLVLRNIIIEHWTIRTFLRNHEAYSHSAFEDDRSCGSHYIETL